MTPLGEARLLELQHTPIYFECFNGQLFVVCVDCCAMSTPVSAAKSGLISKCLGHPATQRAYGKSTQEVVRGKYPQKKGVALTRLDGPPDVMRPPAVLGPDASE